ncbi:archaeal proteasome endopeptidase complex subunit alpha [Candidatus Woesearchaeota archaeon]|nr:MAG: archaeal proteasome endopeptidase complex subunit alpha [Candidatus Woesearchaeota archaeon]
MEKEDQGYDRTATMFSPEGRIIQAEYAKKAAGMGSDAVGIVCNDGVIIIANKKQDKLAGFSEKIIQVDDHIGVAVAGIISDSFSLISEAQVLAQKHRVTYDSEIDVKSVVKKICSVMQSYTQFEGVRPFGVDLMVAGVDEKPHLFVIEPMGTFLEYKASAIGEHAAEIKEELRKEYKSGITLKEAKTLCINILKKILIHEFKPSSIDGFIISLKDRTFKKL